MPSISIELVPRSAQLLEEECLEVKAKFRTLEVANIPDILRLPLRSWEACRFAKRYFRRVIPHLRAIDFCLTEVSPSGLAAVSLIFLATLTPLALIASSIYLATRPERSSYHRVALWSGFTYPALLAVWILVIVIVGRWKL
jgi:hypothetical protein